MRYKNLTKHGHPYADHNGRIGEHRLVAEAALGKHINPGHPIHHVNGNPQDNRPENLVVCEDDEYHFTLHRRARAMAACGNASWRPCVFCGKHDDLANLKPRHDKRQYQHNACAQTYQRERYEYLGDRLSRLHEKANRMNRSATI